MILDPKQAALLRYDDMSDSLERRISAYCHENGISEEEADELIDAMLQLNFYQYSIDDALLLYNALHVLQLFGMSKKRTKRGSP